jgi:hypothetical protein
LPVSDEATRNDVTFSIHALPDRLALTCILGQGRLDRADALGRRLDRHAAVQLGGLHGDAMAVTIWGFVVELGR